MSVLEDPGSIPGTSTTSEAEKVFTFFLPSEEWKVERVSVKPPQSIHSTINHIASSIFLDGTKYLFPDGDSHSHEPSAKLSNFHPPCVFIR